MFFLDRYKETKNWAPFTKLIIKGDSSGWVLDTIAAELTEVCTRLNVDVVGTHYEHFSRNQCIFYTSKYILESRKPFNRWKKPNHRIALPFFHGNPEIDRSVRPLHNTLKKYHHYISRIQVSHSKMKALILQSGIDPHKVFQIPISYNAKLFRVADNEEKMAIRNSLKIPQSAVVIGSFQKDGYGFADGNEPKLIKGPDVFLDVLAQLQAEISELFVLLTGPARGYVISGLEKLRIPYVHRMLNDYTSIGCFYNALDLYLVTSREEGGPRAILETMASGIPLVTTNVGQATDLVEHQQNGWIVETDDVDGLAYWSKYALERTHSLQPVLEAARTTALANSYSAILPLWGEFMAQFVSCKSD